MKTQKQILIFLLSLCFLQNNKAQEIILKGGAMLTGIAYVIDGGIEVPIKDQFSIQISLTKSDFSGEGLARENFLISPQLRYYFKKNSFQKSPYLGFVFQNHTGATGEEIYNNGNPPYGWESTNFNKFGAGLMLGVHGKIYKKLGFDIHIGGIGELGNVNVKKEYWQNAPPNTPNSSYIEKNKTSFRPFFTLNLYLMVGEMTKTENIIKNTEGSF